MAARRLGAEVTLVSRLPPEFDLSSLEGVCVQGQPTDRAARYANSYDSRGNRRQLLLAPGAPLARPNQLPVYDAVILAPAYHELDAWHGPHPGRFTAVALQGALRAVGADDTVLAHPDPVGQSARFHSVDYLFLSTEDTPSAESFSRECSIDGPAVVLTGGAAGASLFRAGHLDCEITAFAANQCDPTGAGDCFLAAFVVRLLETGDEIEAGRFAAAAGALAVEKSGVQAIPERATIERRLLEAGT